MQKKCDIVIPVYKSPEWVSLCVYAIFKTTKSELLDKVILINDCDDQYTENCLNNIKEKYGNKIVLEKNPKNLGFVGSTNKGMKISKASYVLLLNTDCILSKNAIEKMINAMEKNKKVGLLSPISSNAANLTLEMFEGFSYSDMNSLLEKKFSGKTFDACTVVGNCLMISRECIDKVGYLDTAYGLGYGEETDYQFKAMENGFEAKVLIDTYVFHKAEVSFGASKEKQERLKKNRDLFFSRWEKAYNKCIKKYEKNDPIAYIHSHLTQEDKKPIINALFYLPDIVQNAGGCHVITDLVNYMSINGYTSNVVYDHIVNYKEIMLFNPVHIKNINNIKFNQLVTTVWLSVYKAYEIVKERKVPLVNFIQGYEPYFENGNVYGLTEPTYKLSSANLVISKYLQKKLKKYFDTESYVIPNSIHYDLLKRENMNQKIKTFTFVLRGSPMKGDFVLLDIIKMIDKKYENKKINIVYINPYIEFPCKSNNNEINYIKGPLERSKLHSLLSESDIYIDASINEGFGLTPLEAMTAGAIPIVSNSFGIQEYMIDSKNGFIINEVNDAEKYLEKIDELMKDSSLYLKMKKECSKTVKDFDYDNKIQLYIEYFKKCEKLKHKAKQLEQEEQEILQIRNKYLQQGNRTRGFIYKFNKFIPNRLKNILKRIITTMYNSFQH